VDVDQIFHQAIDMDVNEQAFKKSQSHQNLAINYKLMPICKTMGYVYYSIFENDLTKL
jgi:hypothetical protein